MLDKVNHHLKLTNCILHNHVKHLYLPLTNKLFVQFKVLVFDFSRAEKKGSLTHACRKSKFSGGSFDAGCRIKELKLDTWRAVIFLNPQSVISVFFCVSTYWCLSFASG